MAAAERAEVNDLIHAGTKATENIMSEDTTPSQTEPLKNPMVCCKAHFRIKDDMRECASAISTAWLFWCRLCASGSALESAAGVLSSPSATGLATLAVTLALRFTSGAS